MHDIRVVIEDVRKIGPLVDHEVAKAFCSCLNGMISLPVDHSIGTTTRISVGDKEGRGPHHEEEEVEAAEEGTVVLSIEASPSVSSSWTSQERDAVRRCVDRAAHTRVYPALDTNIYAAQDIGFHYVDEGTESRKYAVVMLKLGGSGTLPREGGGQQSNNNTRQWSQRYIATGSTGGMVSEVTVEEKKVNAVEEGTNMKLSAANGMNSHQQAAATGSIEFYKNNTKQHSATMKLRQLAAKCVVEKTINLWMWKNGCKDVIEYALTAPAAASMGGGKKKAPALHVDTVGVEFPAVIVGLTQYDAIFGVLNDGDDGDIVVIGKTSVPVELVHLCPTAVDRQKGEKRSKQSPPPSDLNISTAGFRLPKGRVVWLLNPQRRVVTVMCHRFSVFGPGTLSADGEKSSTYRSEVRIEVEDCVIVMPPPQPVDGDDDAVDDLNNSFPVTNQMLRDMLQTSCAAVRHRQEKLRKKATPLQNRQIKELVVHMSDTRSVHFKKLKGATRGGGGLLNQHGGHLKLPTPLVAGEMLKLDECNTVEFKMEAAMWGGEVDGQRQDFAASSNVERLRHIISAFASSANTHVSYGHLLLGIRDDGMIIGLSPEQVKVAEELRKTGFCPAMVKDAVTTTRYPVRRAATEGSASSSSPSSSSGASNKLPTQWWKPTTTTTTTTPNSTQSINGDANTKNKIKSVKADDNKIVIAVHVQRGTAPFYAPSKGVLPSSRGCASTLPLTARSMVARVVNFTGWLEREELDVGGVVANESCEVMDEATRKRDRE